MLRKSTKNQIQSNVIRKVLAMLDGTKHSPEDNLVFNHVAVMLEEYDGKQAETEQLLCSLIVLILNSFSLHIDTESPLFNQIKLLQLRLQSPITSTELVAIQHYVESCADEITQISDLDEKEIDITLEPLLNSFGLDNKSSYSRAILLNSGKEKRDRTLEPALNHQNDEFNIDSDVVDDSITHLMTSNYLTNSIAQSEKFGVLLEVELATLKSLDDNLLFEEKKSEVLKELEKVLGSHQQLTEYFQKMSDFISGLQQDSIRLSEELDRVTLLSLTDELTCLPNRRAFEQQLNDEIARVNRYGHNLSLALLDIDHFKPINDEYGHSAGDKVLRHYAKDVLSMFRQHDLVARYGGEEFVVIFPNTDLEGASRALRKVQRKASECDFMLNNEKFHLPTFSAGLVCHRVDESREDLIHRADKLLYKAKSNGRNCIEVESVVFEDIDN